MPHAMDSSSPDPPEARDVIHRHDKNDSQKPLFRNTYVRNTPEIKAANTNNSRSKSSPVLIGEPSIGWLCERTSPTTTRQINSNTENPSKMGIVCADDIVLLAPLTLIDLPRVYNITHDEYKCLYGYLKVTLSQT